MKKLTFLFILLLGSCGPSLCDCVWDQTENENACKSVYKTHLGTEYPSFIRLESVRKGSCEEYGEELIQKLKDKGY